MRRIGQQVTDNVTVTLPNGESGRALAFGANLALTRLRSSGEYTYSTKSKRKRERAVKALQWS